MRLLAPLGVLALLLAIPCAGAPLWSSQTDTGIFAPFSVMGLASLGSNPFVGGQAQDQAETSGSLGVAASTPSAPASAPAPSNTLTFGWNTLTDDTSAQSTASFGPSAAPCADPTAPNCSTAAPSQAAPVIQLASALGASLVDDTNLIAIEVIPEPGTAILMGAGLLAVALGAMRRRRIRE